MVSRMATIEVVKTWYVAFVEERKPAKTVKSVALQVFIDAEEIMRGLDPGVLYDEQQLVSLVVDSMKIAVAKMSMLKTQKSSLLDQVSDLVYAFRVRTVGLY